VARASRERSGPPPRRRSTRIDALGYVATATQVPSSNCDDRPPETVLSLIVLHGISLPPGRFGGDAIERLFTNRLDPDAHPYFASIAGLRVSSHFLIRRDGALLQFVPCALRAWHAGASVWQGRERCNDFSIGIELEGTDTRPFATPQYTMLAKVVKVLQRSYPIAGVAGHSDIAPGRKTDPGPAFDWARLHRLLAPSNTRTTQRTQPPARG
jgi:AmpD protein